MERPDPLDAVIVGGGPAGLTAAIYLARFRRRVQVLDAGNGRCAWIPRSHNLPGWPEGIGGAELLRRMREQAELYGAGYTRTRAERIEGDGERGFTVTDADGNAWTARFALLATGVIDREPELPDLFDAVRRGLVRHCPICDAWEVRDSRIAVLGHGAHGAAEALFLRDYSADITLLTLGKPAGLEPRETFDLAEAGIRVEECPVSVVRVEGDRIAAIGVHRAGRLEEMSFDTLYSALGSDPRVDLARAMGAAQAEDGRLTVSDHGETSVSGLYAIGDVTPGLNQIACAEADAARAAIQIHNRLRNSGPIRPGPVIGNL